MPAGLVNWSTLPDIGAPRLRNHCHSEGEQLNRHGTKKMRIGNHYSLARQSPQNPQFPGSPVKTFLNRIGHGLGYTDDKDNTTRSTRCCQIKNSCKSRL